MDLYQGSLCRAGLVAIHQTIMVSGGLQHRYTLYCVETHIMVAWFCWYEKPANPPRYRLRQVDVVEIMTKHDVSEVQKRAAREWLARLRTRHPTESPSRPSP